MPAHTSTNGWPVISTAGSSTLAARRVSFEPATRWSRMTASRRSGRDGTRRRRPRGRRRRASARRRCPSSRRSSPQTCSTSSASCRPSTQIRLARATCGEPDPAIDPELVRRGGDGCGARRRTRQRHRTALEQEPARLPREVAHDDVAVAQPDRLVVPTDDVADEAARAVLDDEPRATRRPPGNAAPDGAAANSSRMSRS